MFKDSELNTFGLRVWDGNVLTAHSPHRHHEIEINAIEKGYLTYMLAGTLLTVSEGDVALFWGAIPHQAIAYAPVTHVHWGTIPLDHVLPWDLPRPFLLGLLSGRMFRDSEPLYDLRFFRQWQTDLRMGHQAQALMEIKSLFFRFAQTAQSEPFPTETMNDRANQMALFMSRRFQEPLTVTQIANEIGLHPNYAMTLFKDAFGLTLIEYLTQQRIAHAQQLLITTDISVTNIALEAGFQTLSHFYTAFHRLCGSSPGRYRSSLRG